LKSQTCREKGAESRGSCTDLYQESRTAEGDRRQGRTRWCSFFFSHDGETNINQKPLEERAGA